MLSWKFQRASQLSFLKVLSDWLTKKSGITKKSYNEQFYTLVALIISLPGNSQRQNHCRNSAINSDHKFRGKKRQMCDVARRSDLSTFLIKEKRGCDRSSDFLVRFPREMLLNTRETMRSIIRRMKHAWHMNDCFLSISIMNICDRLIARDLVSLLYDFFFISRSDHNVYRNSYCIMRLIKIIAQKKNCDNKILHRQSNKIPP